MTSKYKIAYWKNIFFVFYVWIKKNSRFQDLLISYSYDRIYASRNATCHRKTERIVSITLAGFELKQVPGQFMQPVHTIFSIGSDTIRVSSWPSTTPFIVLRAFPGIACWNGQELHHGLFCCGWSREQPQKWKNADFSLHLLCRVSRNSRARLQNGNHAECMV